MKHFIVLGNIFNKARIKALIEGALKFDLHPLFFRLTEANNIEKLVKEHDIYFAVSVGMRAADAYAKGYLNEKGIDTLILDLGYFSRAKGPQDEVGYNQLGINKLCWVPSVNCPEDRFLRHNVKFEQMLDRSEIALVLGQVPGDTQHGLSPSDLKAWLMYQTGVAKAKGYRVEYRPHPKAPTFMAHYKDKLFDRVFPSSSFSLEENVRRASEVITFNSTAGLTALALGRSVISSPSAHYHGISSVREIYEHFCKLSYAQWNCAELSSGEALLFMSSFNPRFTGNEIELDEVKCEQQEALL